MTRILANPATTRIRHSVTPMSIDPHTTRQAVRHLKSVDPTMRKLIDRAGPVTLKLQRNRFEVLVKSIISQQISTKAATSIRRRVEQLAGPGRLTAPRMAALSVDELRTAGVSNQKANYLLDLAQKTCDGEIRFSRMRRMPDDEIIDELVQVKGIGLWTAQMFLMFSLGRLDVFPYGDLGIQKALQALYGLSDLPDKQTAQEIAEPWSPYATIASWYCWRSIDDPEGGDW